MLVTKWSCQPRRVWSQAQCCFQDSILQNYVFSSTPLGQTWGLWPGICFRQINAWRRSKPFQKKQLLDFLKVKIWMYRLIVLPHVWENVHSSCIRAPSWRWVVLETEASKTATIQTAHTAVGSCWWVTRGLRCDPCGFRWGCRIPLVLQD